MGHKNVAGVDVQGWRVEVSHNWDVLGPFPIHAREQHFLSPSFPLNLSEPVDLAATWPSSYADGGAVGWTKAQSTEVGLLEVSFPHIRRRLSRWDSLRATEGWAALQHHSLLRTTLTVHPPSSAVSRTEPRLLVNLLQGSLFTIRPSSDYAGFVPEWHAGNIYMIHRAAPNTISLPVPPSLDSPTTYDFFLSGDYEIRLFGDPRHDTSSNGVPKLSITVTFEIEDPNAVPEPVVRDTSHDVACDFVGGWAFGEALGIGLQSKHGWWTVVDVVSTDAISEVCCVILLSLSEQMQIAPTQTRIVPLQISQTGPLSLDHLDFSLKLKSKDGKDAVVAVTIPIRQYEAWTLPAVRTGGIKASYLYASSMPTAFLVAPPEEPNVDGPQPPILALHGAGLDVFEWDFWIKALPRERHGWVIAPTGRTEWGLDWHGPSTKEAWSTVAALQRILDARESWRAWGIPEDTKVLLMGHSNGGQGAWYTSARFPDRVLGVIPAAGYIKSQAYVPWVMSRSAHYVDPGLRAVLDSSLTPDDNDLFLTNVVHTPILAIHGGDDDNVPVWHTREAVSVVRTWNPQANITYREDPGEPHWYDSLFAREDVASFLSANLASEKSVTLPLSFTLTVAIPSDSGTMHGWAIQSLSVPGRLSRIAVTMDVGTIDVRTSNVDAFTIPVGLLPRDLVNSPIVVDGQTITLDEASWEQPEFILGLAKESTWTVSPYSPSSTITIARTGRIANFLTTHAPFTIVAATNVPSQLSSALRIAHDLNIYHKLDAEIIDDDEATRRLRDGQLGAGNIAVLSIGATGPFATALLEQKKTPFELEDGVLSLRGRKLDGPSTATLFLHPHPSNPDGLTLFVHGSDAAGQERARRLFPIRTGIAVPDWIVIGPHADERGSGGVESAGVWGNDWTWNEVMSAF
ncbi:uncharacterized protein BXZ73DRAFT_37690 [Epithele typhae]|uniref:uncharacterized protein n=1 Tax=Epithele typhae TaxID=378194 RepID=UPI002008149A|nr:uncharacterized protein BXZ73DRAFT_37690 [Epithele typhae]KAH9946364.1 hypothetical protein BXZ73DRAFT_37690 [Epithele typhae]